MRDYRTVPLDGDDTALVWDGACINVTAEMGTKPLPTEGDSAYL
jgi:hypothetical protein